MCVCTSLLSLGPVHRIRSSTFSRWLKKNNLWVRKLYFWWRWNVANSISMFKWLICLCLYPSITSIPCVDTLLEDNSWSRHEHLATQCGLLMAERRGDGLWWLLIFAVRLHHNGAAHRRLWITVLCHFTVKRPPYLGPRALLTLPSRRFILAKSVCFCLSHACTEGRKRSLKLRNNCFGWTRLTEIFHKI